MELLLAPALVIVLINVVTPTSALLPNQADVVIYLHKAQALSRGELPYRDFLFEYPPLALLAMAVPYFAWPWPPPSLEAYRWLFTAWECILLVVLVIVASRMAGRLARNLASPDAAAASRAVATRILILVVVAAPSLAWRFDLLPAVLAALAILWALEGRPALAGAALGLGALAKIYPLVLLPVLAALWLAPIDVRRLTRFGAGLGATVAVGVLPVVALAGDHTWSFLSYQADRGLQLETLPAGLILLVRSWTGGRVPLAFDHGSVEVIGGAARLYLGLQPWLSVISFVALVAFCLVLCRRELRSSGAVQPQTTVALPSAFILLLLLTNKVFSIQYFVWLLPLAAFLPRGQFLLAVLIGALSVGIHPLLYGELIAQASPAVWLLNLRNGLVVALLAWVLASLAAPLRRSRSGSRASRSRPAAAAAAPPP